MRDSFSRTPLVAALVICGIVVSSAGLFLLEQLSHLYRTIDIAYRQSEQTFYDWLAAAIRQQGLASNSLAERVAQRLLIMPTTDRRDAINSMMIDYFWIELAPPGTDRLPIYRFMDKVTRTALASDPLGGDLWLFAAWLRAQTAAFDKEASQLFLLSQRFTPREETLVLQRLDFATQLIKSPPPEVKAAILADLAVLQNTNVNLAKEFSEQLQQ